MEAGANLHRPDVLAAQARRMLRDPRIRALALEFGGNWFDFRRFEEHNAVDRDRFPAFTDALREAMFEEPVHFLMDEYQNDRSVLDILFGRYTFVNALARSSLRDDAPEAGRSGVGPRRKRGSLWSRRAAPHGGVPYEECTWPSH